MKRALISVYDKAGVVELARGLAGLGWEILSTGGTYRTLSAAGVPVREVSEVAGFPEILDGRVKTLQPQIHAGILAIRSNPEHMAQLERHAVQPIDLVVVNLYPFRETVARSDVTFAEAVEQIDIGGPAMIRAAAKNWQDVGVVVSPARYASVLEELRTRGDLSPTMRFALMREAFAHTARYDEAIRQWLEGPGLRLAPMQAGVASSEQPAAGPGQGAAQEDRPAQAGPVDQGAQAAFPPSLSIQLRKIQDLRYGENPHQKAAFYALAGEPAGGGIASATQLHGKELSFNNIQDAHAALELVREFTAPAAVAVKHMNPCGVAVAPTVVEAYRRVAHDADPVSIFGGIVALNRDCDAETAAELKKIFLEIVIAPAFTDDALAILSRKRDLRLLATGPVGSGALPGWDLRRVGGGLLVQEWDVDADEPATWRTVTSRPVPEALQDDLLLAWKVVKHVKSNAIVVAREGSTLGIGAGQMNRIDAARFALARAGVAARGAVLASDAFFPFPDVVEAAGEAGIAAIVQPGGSIRDAESIERANALGVAMVFTGVRHFRH